MRRGGPEGRLASRLRAGSVSKGKRFKETWHTAINEGGRSNIETAVEVINQKKRRYYKMHIYWFNLNLSTYWSSGKASRKKRENKFHAGERRDGGPKTQNVSFLPGEREKNNSIVATRQRRESRQE